MSRIGAAVIIIVVVVAESLLASFDLVRWRRVGLTSIQMMRRRDWSSGVTVNAGAINRSQRRSCLLCVRLDDLALVEPGRGIHLDRLISQRRRTHGGAYKSSGGSALMRTANEGFGKKPNQLIAYILCQSASDDYTG